ncbi:MAG: hypothetical protein NC548_42880 [Lachnospiraceae bacterium]|nr:hypothetical protein [Lachnospiraceae bacterium]
MNKYLEHYIKKAPVNKIILVANVYGLTEHYTADPEGLRIEFFNEHEINDIKNSLRSEEYDFITYFDEHKFIRDVENKKIHIFDNDLVFNLSRNGNGVSKKSLVPTYCDYYGIKYTGSCGYSCSLARNKHHTANLLLQNNLHGLNSWVYNNGWLLDIKPHPDIEVIIKPLYESASKGVNNDSIINTSDDKFHDLVKQKFSKINGPLIIEEFIRGFECKVPVFSLDKIIALDPIGVCIDNKQLLDDKIITQDLSYYYAYTNYFLKDIFGKDLVDEIKNCAEKIFLLLGMENYGRIDCRITPKGDYYFYDFATMPYFTSHSELSYLFKQYGFKQSDIFNVIFNSALINKYNYKV